MQKFVFILLLFTSGVCFAQQSAISLPKYYSIKNLPVTSTSEYKYYSISNKGISNESILTYYSISRSQGIYAESTSNFFRIGKTSNPVINTTEQFKPEETNQEKLLIPYTNSENPNTYALIIGNEDYKSFQTNLSTEQNVAYAINDALIFKQFCNSTIGIPNENIIYIENGSYVQMKQALSQINLICKYANGQARILFYYAGHGLPEETTKEPFIIPVDASGNSLEFAIPLNVVYNALTEYPTKQVVVFLDACFTGAGRNESLIASRGVKIKPKINILNGNIVVFSASSETQASLPYNEMQHGLFTYYLIKKLSETKGDITLGDLSTYIDDNVPLKSIVINQKEQQPKVYYGLEIENSWKNWKLK